MRKFIQTHLSFGERCAKELRSKHTTLFYEAFEVSKGFFRTFPLEKDVPKNFAQNTPLYFMKLLKFQKDFLALFLWIKVCQKTSLKMCYFIFCEAFEITKNFCRKYPTYFGGSF